MSKEKNIKCGICGKIHLPSVLCEDVVKSREERVNNDKMKRIIRGSDDKRE